MVSGLDFARAPRRVPLTARKKGSGYENGPFSIQNHDQDPPTYARSFNMLRSDFWLDPPLNQQEPTA
jgi:hypothetical protein